MTSATDNRTTELLCKLLEERGIEWSHGDAAYETEWSTPDGRHCSAMYWKPTFTVVISGCTPEQAIAATLGSGTCRLDETASYSNANEIIHLLECSKCGRTCEHVNGSYPRCPHCGAKAVER